MSKKADSPLSDGKKKQGPPLSNTFTYSKQKKNGKGTPQKAGKGEDDEESKGFDEEKREEDEDDLIEPFLDESDEKKVFFPPSADLILNQSTTREPSVSSIGILSHLESVHDPRVPPPPPFSSSVSNGIERGGGGTSHQHPSSHLHSRGLPTPLLPALPPPSLVLSATLHSSDHYTPCLVASHSVSTPLDDPIKRTSKLIHLTNLVHNGSDNDPPDLLTPFPGSFNYIQSPLEQATNGDDPFAIASNFHLPFGPSNSN